jgi:hypothetical protein
MAPCLELGLALARIEEAALYAAVRAFSERDPDVPPPWNDHVEIS